MVGDVKNLAILHSSNRTTVIIACFHILTLPASFYVTIFIIYNSDIPSAIISSKFLNYQKNLTQNTIKKEQLTLIILCLTASRLSTKFYKTYSKMFLLLFYLGQIVRSMPLHEEALGSIPGKVFGSSMQEERHCNGLGVLICKVTT